MSDQEKKAMSDTEKAKIIKAMIVAGVSAAGIGAISRSLKAKKERKKAMTPELSSNAIVIPVSKRDFVKDIPTPKELAESRGESLSAKANDVRQDDKPVQTNVEPANELASTSGSTPAIIAPEDLSAIKKNILRGRKFDFFGGAKLPKAAEDNSASNGDGGDDKGGAKKEVKKEKTESGRVILRDQEGRFASPTDPVAVESVEKDAGLIQLGIDAVKSMASPIESGKDILNIAAGKPMWIAGGLLGSVYIAEKISDAINERRRQKAKARQENARDKYVELLEGGDESEKVAESDAEGNSFKNLTGLTMGSAFFIPMALTAMITNRIQENRKAEKKKAKEMANSYPDDPVMLYRVIDNPGEEKIAEAVDVTRFLYKTAEGKEMEISAETLLGTIIVKEAMFADVERAELAASMEKSAQAGSAYSDEEINNAVNYAVDRMRMPENRAHLLRMIQAQQANKADAAEKAFGDMMSWWGSPKNFSAIAKTPEFKRAIASNKDLQNEVIGNLENDTEWKKYRDQQIDDRIAGWGLDRGGILHKIISWLAKTLGFGNMMAKGRVTNGFNSIRDKAQSEIDAREEAARAAEEKRQLDEYNKHFAPLNNFKGNPQDKAKLEADLNDQWMAKQIDGLNSPEAFVAMADRLSQLSPQSPQYEYLYDALSQKKDLSPETFAKLVRPGALGAGNMAIMRDAPTSPTTLHGATNSSLPDGSQPTAVPYAGDAKPGPAPTSSVLSNGTQVNWRPEGQNGPWSKTDIADKEDKARLAKEWQEAAPNRESELKWRMLFDDTQQNALIDDAIANGNKPYAPGMTPPIPQTGSNLNPPSIIGNGAANTATTPNWNMARK